MVYKKKTLLQVHPQKEPKVIPHSLFPSNKTQKDIYFYVTAVIYCYFLVYIFFFFFLEIDTKQ